MSGATVRAAFAAELMTIKAAASIPWEIKDVENVYATADGLTNFLCLEFPPASPPRRMSVGNPGNDYWEDRSTVFVRLVAPINGGRTTIEDYATRIRNAFLGRTFAMTGGQIVRTESTPFDASEHGARWIASVPVSYRTQFRA